METKQISEKTASELNEEIYNLDVKLLKLKDELMTFNEEMGAIETKITVDVRGARELFKNETDRKIEIERRLSNESDYEIAKGKRDATITEKSATEIRKSFFERQVRIILNENPETLKKLTEVSGLIRKLEMDEAATKKEVSEITDLQKNRLKEINKAISNKVFKNDEERGKASVERILKDETIKKCVSDLKPLNDKLTQLKIDIEFFQRTMIVMGVVRGVKL